MTVYAAFLRGINVGSRKRLPMADLKAIVAEAGGEDVVTYVQSGNAVFRSTAKPPALEKALEGRLREHMGFDVPVILRTAAQMKKVVDASPWAGRDIEPTKLVVVFHKEAARRAYAAIDAAAFAPEELVAKGKEAYLHLPGGQGRSKLAEALAKQKGGPVATTRNWRSVTKILALAESYS